MTSDLLLDRPLLSLGGEPDGSILSNVGEMVNKGVEIELIMMYSDLTTYM